MRSGNYFFKNLNWFTLVLQICERTCYVHVGKMVGEAKEICGGGIKKRKRQCQQRHTEYMLK